MLCCSSQSHPHDVICRIIKELTHESRAQCPRGSLIATPDGAVPGDRIPMGKSRLVQGFVKVDTRWLGVLDDRMTEIYEDNREIPIFLHLAYACGLIAEGGSQEAREFLASVVRDDSPLDRHQREILTLLNEAIEESLNR